ncbi:MAG: hypothetical protein AAGF19_04470, partial [Pseudomonadota bacterium]
MFLTEAAGIREIELGKSPRYTETSEPLGKVGRRAIAGLHDFYYLYGIDIITLSRDLLISQGGTICKHFSIYTANGSVNS